MKKIINGKRYDTETAAKLAIDYSEKSKTDFSYWQETLYQKKTGEYFLHGEGGPMTKYSVWIGENTFCGGEKIIPLTLDQARAWGENHMTVDEYTDIFGQITE